MMVLGLLIVIIKTDIEQKFHLFVTDKREYTYRNFILKQLERGDDYIQTKSGQKY